MAMSARSGDIGRSSRAAGVAWVVEAAKGAPGGRSVADSLAGLDVGVVTQATVGPCRKVRSALRPNLGRGHRALVRLAQTWRIHLMKVLVAVASKHGATTEIGQVIEASIRSSGLDAELRQIDEVRGLGAYAAVVIGSGVYAGHWMRPAREFVEVHEGALRQLPVWLFSSGPVGDPPKPLENPAEATDLVKRLEARGHRLFPGRIEGSDLGISERALVALVRAPDGDFRPWSEISTWAESIAHQLQEPDAA
jgi:menaquinone-dependent protoporphyrinogen oxidase